MDLRVATSDVGDDQVYAAMVGELPSGRRAAVCSCGWHGPERVNQVLGRLDVEEHMATHGAELPGESRGGGTGQT